MDGEGVENGEGTVDGELYRNLFTIGDLHREEVGRRVGQP